jgi:hypothetical protein
MPEHDDTKTVTCPSCAEPLEPGSGWAGAPGPDPVRVYAAEQHAKAAER